MTRNNTDDNSRLMEGRCFLVIVLVSVIILVYLFPSGYNSSLFIDQLAYATARSIEDQTPAIDAFSFLPSPRPMIPAALLGSGETIVGISDSESGEEMGTAAIAAINPITYSLAEICNNGADDNTNGQIDEGCNLSPDCSTAIPSQTSLISTDHHLEEIRIGGVTDPNNDPVVLTITDIIQDEPINGLGNDDQSPDAILTAGDIVQMRSERAENGDGRVYYISFVANDGRGGQCDGVVAVNVPNNQIGLAIDSGTYFSSLK
jgi:hypothetical protein